MQHCIANISNRTLSARGFRFSVIDTLITWNIFLHHDLNRKTCINCLSTVDVYLHLHLYLFIIYSVFIFFLADAANAMYTQLAMRESAIYLWLKGRRAIESIMAFHSETKAFRCY